MKLKRKKKRNRRDYKELDNQSMKSQNTQLIIIPQDLTMDSVDLIRIHRDRLRHKGDQLFKRNLNKPHLKLKIYFLYNHKVRASNLRVINNSLYNLIYLTYQDNKTRHNHQAKMHQTSSKSQISLIKSKRKNQSHHQISMTYFPLISVPRAQTLQHQQSNKAHNH